MSFFNKEWSSSPNKRTQLRNSYLKNQNKRLLYTKQRNFCVSLLRKTKKKHYANLHYKDIADNKQYCGTLRPLLADKSKSNQKATLAEDNKIISEDKSNAELLN